MSSASQTRPEHGTVEQDHRFIKRLVKPGLRFFLSETAWRTLQGYKAMNMLRKGQIYGLVLPFNMQDIFAEHLPGLVFDIDGTLSPIVSTPNEARLYPGVVGLLENMRMQAHVAILTGREIEDGARMINLDGLTYIGTHGLEWSYGLPRPETIRILPEAEQYIQPARELLTYAEKQLDREIGVSVEYKRIGGAVHLSPCPQSRRGQAEDTGDSGSSCCWSLSYY